ncbi:MAG: Rab family GTPase [Promethearchaeota archaeon]
MKSSIFKIGILGDGGAGKTSLLRARKDRDFIEESKITIGVDVAVIPFELTQIDKQNPTFLAFDLGGQERFQFVHDSYLIGVKAAIIVYDLTRYPSFLSIPKWYNLIYHENPMIPVFVVGTKKDLADEGIIKKSEENFEDLRKNLPNSRNIIAHFCISAKTGEGVDELFTKCEETIQYYYSLEDTINVQVE